MSFTQTSCQSAYLTSRCLILLVEHFRNYSLEELQIEMELHLKEIMTAQFRRTERVVHSTSLKYFIFHLSTLETQDKHEVLMKKKR